MATILTTCTGPSQRLAGPKKKRLRAMRVIERMMMMMMMMTLRQWWKEA